jgi:predicted amidohydrolase YtcJ
MKLPIPFLSLLPFLLAAKPADLVLMNGRIVTVDEGFRVAKAMAVKDGRVIAVGMEGVADSWVVEGTKVVDLCGKMVLPGLIDSHVHPTGASLFESSHEIPPMESIADVLDYIRGRAKVVPEGEWLLLSQVFITRLNEQRFPTRVELDEAAPKHPVVFRTGPDASVNSLALAENGIDKAFAKEHPAHVMVDADGEPTGKLLQYSKVLKWKSNSTHKSLDEAARDNWLVRLFQDYNRSGITGIIDRNCSTGARAQYERLLNSGQLTVRVRVSRGIGSNGDLAAIHKTLDDYAADPYFRNPDPRFGVLGVKVYQDGGMLTGSAWFQEPWGKSQIYGISDPKYRGMQFITESRIEELVRACVSRGLAFTAHSQGDAATTTLARIFASVDKDIRVAPTRSSITHSSFMTQEAIALAKKVGFGIDLQPAWLWKDGYTLNKHFGDKRLRYFIPLKSLFDAGIKAGGGSDHMQKIGPLRSVNPYDPFLGMWVTLTRKAQWLDTPIHPEQALNRQEMIRYYTINNAWLMKMETETGSLEIGKRADFIILDRDLLECPVDDVRETKVLSTWMDGMQL